MSIDLVIKLECSECGSCLDYSEKIRQNGDIDIKVEPCDCTKEDASD